MRVPPRGAAGIACHEAAAGSIHWAESPAALNQLPPPVLTSAFVAIGCMTVERVGATTCTEHFTGAYAEDPTLRDEFRARAR